MRSARGFLAAGRAVARLGRRAYAARRVSRRFAAGVVWLWAVAVVAGCAPSSHAEARRTVIPTPPVFEDDEDQGRIAVRAIWIAYAGAKGARADLTRTHAEAHERADMVAGVAQMSGESFVELERKYSDRSGLVTGGGAGAILERGNGLLPKAAETAAFRLAVGEVSPAVETEEGFVVVKRTGLRGATGAR